MYSIYWCSNCSGFSEISGSENWGTALNENNVNPVIIIPKIKQIRKSDILFFLFMGTSWVLLQM